MQTSNFVSVLINSSPVFIAIALGFIAQKFQILGKDANKTVSAIAFKFICPFLVFNVLAGLTFNKSNIGLFIIAILIFTFLLFFGALVAKILRLEKKSISSVSLAFASFGIGSFAYPFIQLNFSNEIFQNVVLFDIAIFLTMLTVGYGVAIYFGKKGDFSLGYSLKKIFTNPIVVAMIVTLCINYIGIKIPAEMLNISTFFSRSFAFLAAFLLGLNLKMPKLKIIHTLFLSFILRISVTTGIVLIINRIHPFDTVQLTAIILSITTPFSTIPVIYAQEQELDVELASQLAVLSIILSIISYPIIISILK